MPLYNPDHIEYEVTSGHIQIAMEDGTHVPAYWAHPVMGAKFPGIALIHDWWGVTPIIRRMTMLLAQTGYYVIVPDLFDGKIATSAAEALGLLDALGNVGYRRANTALGVLETHRHCNGDVAAVGFGMGGSLAFEAAIVRADLEAAVAFGGFPQRYLGHFQRANTPILAFYGAQETFVTQAIIDQLRGELAACKIDPPHQVVMLDGIGHDLFADTLTEPQQAISRAAWGHMLDFLDDRLEGPTQPPERKRF
ncbi:MAG: dienelactone hydrolase family protein [Anaerolineae bacterium]|nr:dienelactone hydrolase family protein [Anaerolineae bacterium]